MLKHPIHKITQNSNFHLTRALIWIFQWYNEISKMKIFVRHLAQKIGQRLAKSFLVPKVKVSTWNILMTLPKNAQEPNLPPQNSTVVAITIAATTFVVHPLVWNMTNNFTCSI